MLDGCGGFGANNDGTRLVGATLGGAEFPIGNRYSAAEFSLNSVFVEERRTDGRR